MSTQRRNSIRAINSKEWSETLWYNKSAEGLGFFYFRRKRPLFFQVEPFPQQEAKLERWRPFAIAEGKMNLENFWRRVYKTDTCWIWKGKRLISGYGQYYEHNKSVGLAHRLSWELKNGPIPHGLLICHHCDNPSCVNPDHLFVGSQKDNMHDCSLKGRINAPKLFGEDHPKSKLTTEQVRTIRASALSMKKLAQTYNVTEGCVRAVIHRLTWKEV